MAARMKCDGPSQVPCRGCRASGSTCVFEARTRPKSLSVVPSRSSPFFAGPLQARPGTPTGVPGFYPSGSQIAPPIVTSRPEPYALRHAREPMPPPPATSISALTSSYPPPQPRPHSPPLPSSSTAPSYHQPLTLPPPPFSSTSVQRPSSSFSESRLNNLESSMRSQSNTMVTIQASIEYLQRSHDSLIAVQQRSARARETVIEVPETVWETYRSRAWPLTPWLVGLREAQGLPGLVVNWLGKRIKAESRREGENAIAVVMIEVGRLVADRVDWTREEIRALGVLA